MSTKYVTIIIIIFVLLLAGILLTKEKTDDLVDPEKIVFEDQTTTLKCDNSKKLDITYSMDKTKVRVKALEENIDIILDREVSASGVKYSASDYVFWNKGDDAYLEFNENTIFNNCKASVGDDDQMSVSRVGQLSDKVVVSNPIVNSRIKTPLVIKGLAPGNWFFEAIAPVVLTNWDGLIIAESYITSEGDWMTTNQVPFSGVIEFEVDPDVYSDRGFLILKKSNASGLPEHDAAVEIPIYFEIN